MVNDLKHDRKRVTHITRLVGKMNLHLGRGFFLKSLWSAVAKVSLLILFPMLVICSAKAELRIDITKGQIEPTPIAISDLFGSGAEESVLGKRVSDIISRNLERSGLFRPIDQIF